MTFTDMELAIIERALMAAAAQAAFDAVDCNRKNDAPAAHQALKRASVARDLANKIANRF